METYHDFFENWNINSYLADEVRESIGGEEFQRLKKKVISLKKEGFELLHIKTKGHLHYEFEEKPLIVHMAQMFAYNTNNGEVYAKIYVLPVKSVTTDANNDQVYESITENGEKIYFTIYHRPGSPAALDQVYLQKPRFV